MDQKICALNSNFSFSYAFYYFDVLWIKSSLMKLFEGGILDKITNDEYERMFQSMQVAQKLGHEGSNKKAAEETAESEGNDEGSSNSIDGDENLKSRLTNEKELTALSLRMLQGAFYLALIGYTLALITFIAEIGYVRFNNRITSFLDDFSRKLHTFRTRFRHF